MFSLQVFNPILIWFLEGKIKLTLWRNCFSWRFANVRWRKKRCSIDLTVRFMWTLVYVRLTLWANNGGFRFILMLLNDNWNTRIYDWVIIEKASWKLIQNSLADNLNDGDSCLPPIIICNEKFAHMKLMWSRLKNLVEMRFFLIK